MQRRVRHLDSKKDLVGTPGRETARGKRPMRAAVKSEPNRRNEALTRHSSMVGKRLAWVEDGELVTTGHNDGVFLDLFAGCGGLSLGAEGAGLKAHAAVESDGKAAATYRLNFPHANVVKEDIRAVTPSALGVPSNLRAIFAGPPCQPFSASNQRSRGPAHPNNTLYIEALRFVSELRPELVVFENVEGFGLGKARAYHDELCDRLLGLGYSVSSTVYCAADFGVPQSRRRLFVVGTQHKPLLGTPAHRASVTVGEAIEDLPKLSVGADEDVLPYPQFAGNLSDYAQELRGQSTSCSGHLVTRNAPHIVDRYQHIPPGGNWKNIPDTKLETYADARRCHTGIYHRLRSDRTAKVIGNFRKNMLVHPWDNRGLSVREAARLQSFPDSFSFSGSIGKQQQQVGNAVPPLLAAAITNFALAR